MLGVLYKGGGGCCVNLGNFGITFIRKDLLLPYQSMLAERAEVLYWGCGVLP